MFFGLLFCKGDLSPRTPPSCPKRRQKETNVFRKSRCLETQKPLGGLWQLLRITIPRVSQGMFVSRGGAPQLRDVVDKQEEQAHASCAHVCRMRTGSPLPSRGLFCEMRGVLRALVISRPLSVRQYGMDAQSPWPLNTGIS